MTLLDGRLDALCGENIDKSIEKLTECLLAKNIKFPFSFSLQHLRLLCTFRGVSRASDVARPV